MERSLPEAVVAVLLRGDHVLAAKRGPDVMSPGYWTLPSGRIEPGESQADAVVREVREELGIEGRALEKVWECPTDDGSFLLHWWTVDADASDLRPNPDEVAAVQWVTAEEFLVLEPTFAGDHEFFQRVLPGLLGYKK